MDTEIFSANTAIKGRGASENPTGRFEAIDVTSDGPLTDEDGRIRTRFYTDNSKSIITFNDSPDVGMSASINPYRGCEHGCIYCYARPTHEYLGMSCGVDFESKILVKRQAPQLLRKKLASPSWQPQTVALSGVTDPYQPIERKLKLTRQCLEVLAVFRNPVALITKNHLITRDIDILSELAQYQAVCAFISITSLDDSLQRVLEPRTASPALRLDAVHQLSQAGIPVGVMIAPIIPGLTDHEIDAILKQAAEAGAKTAYYTMLRLPYGVKDIFQTWLENHYPDRKDRVLNRIKDVRGGQLNGTQFGSRMKGGGTYADYIAQMFALIKKRHGLDQPLGSLSTASFNNGRPQQLQLF